MIIYCKARGRKIDTDKVKCNPNPNHPSCKNCQNYKPAKDEESKPPKPIKAPQKKAKPKKTARNIQRDYTGSGFSPLVDDLTPQQLSKIAKILRVKTLAADQAELIRLALQNYLDNLTIRQQTPTSKQIKKKLRQVFDIAQKLQEQLTPPGAKAVKQAKRLREKLNGLDASTLHALRIAGRKTRVGALSALLRQCESTTCKNCTDRACEKVFKAVEQALKMANNPKQNYPSSPMQAKLPLRQLIDELVFIYQDVTGRTPTITIDPGTYKGKGRFFNFVKTIVSFVTPVKASKRKKDNTRSRKKKKRDSKTITELALIKQIQRAEIKKPIKLSLPIPTI